MLLPCMLTPDKSSPLQQTAVPSMHLQQCTLPRKLSFRGGNLPTRHSREDRQKLFHCAASQKRPSDAIRRRTTLLSQLLLATSVAASAPSAKAVGFQKELKRRKIPLEEYSTLENGIKYFDVSSGTGELATPGKTVSVHFDVMYKTLDVVSTRSARLLGGNRSVAEPFDFVVGEPVSQAGVKKINDSANGLFAGQAGVKPPVALSTAVVGMKAGGKRIVNVPPEVGYGDKGLQEIPPGATVQLNVELLRVLK